MVGLGLNYRFRASFAYEALQVALHRNPAGKDQWIYAGLRSLSCSVDGHWLSERIHILRLSAGTVRGIEVTNCWLVLYTWLQHTDVDIPHFDEDRLPRRLT